MMRAYRDRSCLVPYLICALAIAVSLFSVAFFLKIGCRSNQRSYDALVRVVNKAYSPASPVAGLTDVPSFTALPEPVKTWIRDISTGSTANAYRTEQLRRDVLEALGPRPHC